MTGIFNARILASVAMLVFVGAAIAASTGAFFSDTETSTGNTFTAGDVTISIIDLDHLYQGEGDAPDQPTFTDNGFSFGLGDLKPLDTGTITYGLENGSNDAYLCAAIVETSNNDNGINDPESDAGDATDGLGGGELGQFLAFKFNGNEGVLDGNWQSLGTVSGDAFASSSIEYCFGEYVGGVCELGAGNYNLAQTDSLTADVHFYAVQTRNNPNFQCSSLPPASGTTTPTAQGVGASLASYSAPATCNATVTGTGSIQTAVSAATSGQTVCVADSYDRTGDNTAIRIENAGVTLSALTRGIDLDVPVVLSASNVTVTGFDGAIGQAESGAEQTAFYLDNDAAGFALTFNSVTSGSGAGILTETGAALAGGLIANNVLSGVTQGIYLNPHTGTITIEYNDIENNAAGIAGLNGATVRFNEFDHSSASAEAIGIDGSSDDNASTISTNNFLNGTQINVYNGTVFGTVGNAIPAPNNFFSVSAAAQVDPPVNATTPAASQYPHN